MLRMTLFSNNTTFIIATASSLLYIPTQTYPDLFHLLYQVDFLLQNYRLSVHGMFVLYFTCALLCPVSSVRTFGTPFAPSSHRCARLAGPHHRLL